MTIVALSLLAIVLLIFIIGLSMPARREYLRQSELKASPDKVFRAVTDVASQPAWRSDVKEIKVVDSISWTEIPYRGTPLTFRVKQKVENHIFEIEIVESASINGSWIGIFEQNGTGTKVEFKEVIVVKNPFMRVMSVLFTDLDKTMDLYMRNLRNKLGE